MYRHVTAIRSILLLVAALPCAPARAESASQRYRLAAGSYETRDWQRAVEQFQRYIANHPHDERVPAARFFIGEALVQLRRYDEARQAFQEFLSNSPSHRYASQAQFRTGESAYLQGDDRQARADLRKFQQRFPQDPLNAYVLPYLGELALSLNDAADAETMYQSALRQFPAGPLADQCRLGLGRAFELQGNHEQALRFYRFLSSQRRTALADDAMLQECMMAYNAGKLAAAEKSFQQLLTAFPTSELKTDARYWLGVIQSRQQRWPQAAETLRGARPSDSNHKLAPAIEFSLATALRNSGRVDEADAHYARLVTAWPRSKWGDDSLQSRVRIALDAGEHDKVDRLARAFASEFPESELLGLVRAAHGQSLLASKRYAEAGNTFSELLADSADASPEDRARWKYLLAHARMGTGEYESTLRVLDEIPTRDERTADIHAMRGVALFNLDRHEEAAESYQAYLAASPDGTDAAQCRAQLAVSLAKLGRDDEAMQAFDQLLTFHRDDVLVAPTAEILAEVAYAKKNWTAAKALFRHLASPNYPSSTRAKGESGLAWTHMKLGETDDAAQRFQRCLVQFPDSSLAPEAAFMRAQLLEQADRQRDALQAYDIVLEKFGDSSYVPQTLWRSAQLLRVADDLHSRNAAVDRLERLALEHPQLAFHDAVLYQWAWLLNDLGREQEGTAAFERLVTEHPDSAYRADAAYRLADNAFRAGDLTRAKQFIEPLLAEDVKAGIVGHALYLRGRVAANESQWQQVIEQMERVARDYPQSAVTLPAAYWTAEAHYRLKNYAEAGRRFQRLLEETAEQQDDWLAIIPMRRAQVFAHQRQWLDAYEVAAKIEERFPRFAQQHEVDYLIGRSLAARAKFSDARTFYQRVIDSPVARDTEMAAMAQWMIGETYFHQKNLDDAIEAYHRVFSLYGFDHWRAASLLQAGKCHEAKGEAGEAIRLYQRIISDFPQTPFARKATDELESVPQVSPPDP